VRVIDAQCVIAVAQFLFPIGVEHLPAGGADRLGAGESPVAVTGPDGVLTRRRERTAGWLRFIAHRVADNLSI
jgi:hypothetical protein